MQTAQHCNEHLHTHTNTDTRIYRGETSVCRVVAGLAALEGAVINSLSVQQLRRLLYCSTSTYFEFPRKSIVLQFLEVLGIEFYRKRTRFSVMYVTPQSSITFLELQKLLLNRISLFFIICGSFGVVFTISIASNPRPPLQKSPNSDVILHGHKSIFLKLTSIPPSFSKVRVHTPSNLLYSA